MLKELRIFNIILIESAEIFFEAGLNVITGETGSGKSAIMHALSLIAGVRADSSIVRKGKDKGAVEARFENILSSVLIDILEEAGIAYQPEEDLIIRREIQSSGKSRAYINNQLVQISLLKLVGECVIEIVSQHASRHLLSLEAHGSIIDLYGDLEEDVSAFTANWERENLLHKKLTHLIHSEGQRLRETEMCLRELEELQQASLKEGEDEELFAEYSLLVSSEERSCKSSALLQVLNGEKQSILNQLRRQKGLFEELTAIDSLLHPSLESFSNALVELEEVAYTLAAYHHRVECNPEQSERLNDRMTLINQMKRKYGATIPEIQEYQKKLSQRLQELENCDADIENIKQELDELAKKNGEMAKALTLKRKRAANVFAQEIVEQLTFLNMPKVEFEVEISPRKRTKTGDDHVEFYLSPNVGEHRIPIKECASGGELSRILLALHVVMAGKEQIPTLVFDEIDEGVGGKTAGLIGDKLREIGNKHQVLCITHFPQVAKQAAFHLQISKSEREGRTATEIQLLDEASRHKELSRMVGSI